MESLFDKKRKVYMIGCGALQDSCKVYDMEPQSGNVEIFDQGKFVCKYTQKDMLKFISIGFATVL